MVKTDGQIMQDDLHIIKPIKLYLIIYEWYYQISNLRSFYIIWIDILIMYLLLVITQIGTLSVSRIALIFCSNVVQYVQHCIPVYVHIR